MSIYTKNGDSGFASTMNRRMIPKNSPVFAVLGTLDELSSALGLAKSKLPEETKAIVQVLQEDLIAFSGELAGGEKFATESKVCGMEKSIDMMMESVGHFEGFITSGKNDCGACLDLSRSIARRAERELVANKQTGGVGREAMIYLNRLSDFIYALARVAEAGSLDVAEKCNAKSNVVQSETFLDLALKLCHDVLEEAKKMNLSVVTAACDSGGNPVALMRADGAYIASVEIAQNKAYTSVSLQMSTEKLSTLSQPNGPLYGIQNTNQNRMVIFGGGIPLLKSGVLIGGFGVSGGSSEQDTGLAHFAEQYFQELIKGGR